MFFFFYISGISLQLITINQQWKPVEELEIVKSLTKWKSPGFSRESDDTPPLPPPPISLTESFLHKLGRFDTQCAEMLLLNWWGSPCSVLTFLKDIHHITPQ